MAPSADYFASAPSSSAQASTPFRDRARPRMSPNDRVGNTRQSYFIPPTPRDERGPSTGGGFDFAFGGAVPVKKTGDDFDWGAQASGSASGGAGAGPGPGATSASASEPATRFFPAGSGPTNSSSRVFANTPGGMPLLGGQPSFTSPSSGDSGGTNLQHPHPRQHSTSPRDPPSATAFTTNPFNFPMHQPPTPSFTLPSAADFAPAPRTIRTPLTGSRMPPAAAGQHVNNVRYTSFTPAALLTLLAFPPSSGGPAALILDLRPHSAWVNCRARASVNICVPSTLLRRPNHGVEQIAAALSTTDRAEFQRWTSPGITVIVLDGESTSLVDKGGIASLLAKFVKAGFTGKLGWVRGGFVALRQEALGGAASSRDLLEFGPVERSSDDASAFPDASSGKHARPVLQVRDLPISAFQASSTSAFTHAGLPSANINMGGRSSAGSKASSSGRPIVKRRKSGTEGFNLDGLSMAGTATPAPREVAEKRMATNPFFDNIRQNSEALSLERSLANLTPVDMPAVSPSTLSRLPPFLASLIRLSPTERAQLLAKQFYDLEVAERERLEGTLNWHANHQGKEDEHTTEGYEYKKFGISAGIELGSLNRYKNIFPYDHARVRLSSFGPGATDYVNASHIQLAGSPRKFIASQGPLQTTFPDFWQMCDQESVGVIIMLTNLHEGGREKCGRYWIPPQSGDWDVEVQGDSQDEEGGGGFFAAAPAPKTAEEETTIRRSILVHRKQDPPSRRRKIRHIQYRAWPDFDIPAKPSDVVELVREVEAAQREYLAESNWQGTEEPPVLAHCSAGVGRTGVFIMVSAMLDKLARDRKAERQQRPAPKIVDSMEVDQPEVPMTPVRTGSDGSSSISAGLSAATLFDLEHSASHESGTTMGSSSPDTTPALSSAEPLFRGVNEMREQRMSMVANYRQFCCVHECVLAGALLAMQEEKAGL
ncbi:tyrosine-protein phosphatase 2/3, partial [Phenoliferia sp. Uapishka_3]